MMWRFSCSNILKQEQNEVQLAQQVGSMPVYYLLFSGARLAESNSPVHRKHQALCCTGSSKGPGDGYCSANHWQVHNQEAIWG